MDTDTLLLSAKELLDAGDEEGLRTFLVEHIHELPEELRNQLVAFFFTETVTLHAEGIQAETEFIRDSLTALDELGELRTILAEQVNLAAVRSRLSRGDAPAQG